MCPSPPLPFLVAVRLGDDGLSQGPEETAGDETDSDLEEVLANIIEGSTEKGLCLEEAKREWEEFRGRCSRRERYMEDWGDNKQLRMLLSFYARLRSKGLNVRRYHLSLRHVFLRRAFSLRVFEEEAVKGFLKGLGRMQEPARDKAVRRHISTASYPPPSSGTRSCASSSGSRGVSIQDNSTAPLHISSIISNWLLIAASPTSATSRRTQRRAGRRRSPATLTTSTLCSAGTSTCGLTPTWALTRTLRSSMVRGDASHARTNGGGQTIPLWRLPLCSGRPRTAATMYVHSGSRRGGRRQKISSSMIFSSL